MILGLGQDPPRLCGSRSAVLAMLATIRPGFTDAGRLALAGFLAGCRSLTRQASAV